MLSHLDCIIFPDRCEVVELIPSQRYIYPIFKNGHSSLLVARNENRWRVLLNEQISKIKTVDIILRDPVERMISGINTYVQMTLKENPSLDHDTVLWFAENYLFLNRHYAPQFLWILNLARYLNKNTKLNFYGIEEVSAITGLNKKPEGIAQASQQIVEVVKHIKHNEMYQRIDQHMFDSFIGKSLTFMDIVEYIQKADPAAYEWVIGRSKRILDPLYVLPKT